MNISITKYPLVFKQAAGTSRGILRKKNTWFLKLFKANSPKTFGLGEINMFEGLSYDDRDNFYSKLTEISNNPELYINSLHDELKEFPSIRFGLESAIIDYHQKCKRILFPSDFTLGKEGIPINGLIWMGKKDFMIDQIKSKLNNGFKCLKLKIGSIYFEEEISILKMIRNEFNENDLEIRVDANGAFGIDEALFKLERLTKLKLHSIEQPIKQGQIKIMQELCKNTPLPIALDEELIGINDLSDKKQLLEDIRPQYIILKPALTGGIKASEEWIKIADTLNIDWWITSALESNIGLNVIAQWTYSLNTSKYQGLGTGQLFTNNIESPLMQSGERLFHSPEKKWEIIP